MIARDHRASRLAAAAMLAVSIARGQSATGAPGVGRETPPEAAARAREHFQRGRELYQAGSYREAIVELEAAQALDPHAKDLVYNLAVVNEKLGQIDAAIRYVHAYADMDLEAQERARADAYLKRLEGAKREVDARVAAAAASAAAETAPATSSAAATPTTEAPPPRGRVDAATVTAVSFGVAGLTLGAVLGVTALVTEPKNFISGQGGQTYADYLADQQRAHTEAIVADVGFGVGVAAAAIAAYLYFGRSKAVAPSQPTVTATPVTDGGHGAVFAITGRF